MTQSGKRPRDKAGIEPRSAAVKADACLPLSYQHGGRLSNLIAELTLCTKWHVTRHVTRDKRSMCCA